MDEDHKKDKKDSENDPKGKSEKQVRASLTSEHPSQALLEQTTSRRPSKRPSYKNEEDIRLQGESPPNVALTYGLEDNHDDRQTARVVMIKHPNRKEKMHIIVHADNPVVTAKAKTIPTTSRAGEQLLSGAALNPGKNLRSTPSGTVLFSINEVNMDEPRIPNNISSPKIPNNISPPKGTPENSDPLNVNEPPSIAKAIGSAKVNKEPFSGRFSASDLFKAENGTVLQKVNESNNTNISIQPKKMFSDKSTNTSGSNLLNPAALQSKESEPKPYVSTLPPGVFVMEDAFAFAVNMVRSAGAFALNSNKTKGSMAYTCSEDGYDINTPTNNEVEQMMVKAISEKYPDHKIISEKRILKSATGGVTLTKDHTWIIDPIEGTTNFVHHFPYYCISVAFFLEKENQFGIVYSPPLKEMYTAKKDQGAFLNNNEKLIASGQSALKEAMVLQEYNSGKGSQTSIDNTNKLIHKTHALRSIGSSAMGLAMVAAGKADAVYFFGPHVWDMAAGIMLVREAGGTVVDPAGATMDIMSRRLLAAGSESLAQQLSVELTQQYPKPRDDEAKFFTPAPIPPPIAPVDSAATREEAANHDTVTTRDFNAQTEFTDSSISLSSTDSFSKDRVKNDKKP